jgi:hypothetical protein
MMKELSFLGLWEWCVCKKNIRAFEDVLWKRGFTGERYI